MYGQRKTWYGFIFTMRRLASDTDLGTNTTSKIVTMRYSPTSL